MTPAHRAALDIGIVIGAWAWFAFFYFYGDEGKNGGASGRW